MGVKSRIVNKRFESHIIGRLRSEVILMNNVKAKLS